MAVRLGALVNLGTVDVGEVGTTDWRRFELHWLAAGGTDTVTVDVCGFQPPRVGTVVGLDGKAPRLVVSYPMHQPWLDRDNNQAALVDAVAGAYEKRPQD